jgi:hypothetical protein
VYICATTESSTVSATIVVQVEDRRYAVRDAQTNAEVQRDAYTSSHCQVMQHDSLMHTACAQELIYNHPHYTTLLLHLSAGITDELDTHQVLLRQCATLLLLIAAVHMCESAVTTDALHDCACMTVRVIA